MKHATLCFLLDEKEKKVLLGLKKKKLGKGLYNGPGGKVDDGETPSVSACREVFEEICVSLLPESISKAAELSFFFSHKNKWYSELFVHVFLAKKWEGIPRETSEFKPEWFSVEKIPFEKMWSDDRHWLPLVLQGKKVKAKFSFAEDEKTIEGFSIKEISGDF